tara:strand:- start:455 stop:886 length:432 start_codon:yes stop_codon:yes gene_type:complete
MAKSNLLEAGILKLVYQNIALANIGNAGGLLPSSVAGSLYVALYTEDPTDADTGVEATYTGYARIAVVRSAVGWTVLENEVSNAAILTFPTNTGTSQTVTHLAIRTASTGGDIVHQGALAVPLVIENGNTPKFEIGDLAITED